MAIFLAGNLRNFKITLSEVIMKTGMDNNTVKENIIRRRKRLKLSQQDVAEKIGMSRTAYRNIEKGDTRLLSENIGKIADAFGVAAEELVLGYDADPEHDQTLCDGISYKRMYEDLRTQYNADSRRHSEEIARLMTEIATLKDYIAMQKDLIGTKDEIISMLKKLGGGK